MINLKKLLTEEVQPKKPKLQESTDLVRSGLEKVFASGGPEISYRRLENVGLGYIRSVSDAFKCAIQESRKIAKSFGYKDDEVNAKFIKEDNDFGKMSAENPEDRLAQVHPEELPHDETDMSNPAEKEEVKLAKKIKLCTSLLKKYLAGKVDTENGSGTGATIRTIEECADKLLNMHGEK